jgi:uncharacterized membrane protein
MTNVLLAGESWASINLEIKGRNVVSDSDYREAGVYMIAALESAGADVTFQPCHVAATDFPRTIEAFDHYDLVVLSDVGADTLQITRQVADGKPDVDRLSLLAEYVRDGGALGMVGGYMSFAGKGGEARYGSTPVADVLPVEISPYDDRIEAPGGINPETTGSRGAPAGLPDRWPAVLGYNRVVAKDDAEVWATVGDDPLVVTGDHGEGRAFALTSDCAPHWASRSFLEWEELPVLWEHLLDRVI